MPDYLSLAGTALNKRPYQLFGTAKRYFKSAIFPRIPINIDERYERSIPDTIVPHTEPIRENTKRLQESVSTDRGTYESQAAAATEGEVTFLNRSVSFRAGTAVAADAPAVMNQPLHWRLKFWGFEHLKPIWLTGLNPAESPDQEIAVHRAWLDDWKGSHPIASDSGFLRRYWMPHSVSLRILNWARYDSLFEAYLDKEFREEICRFVYKNAAFLADNVEYGVGGNHLIENATALVVAGVYTGEREWRRRGRQILERASRRQFFRDGGHIERSPMYHLIVCQRFLTAVDVLEFMGEKSGKIRTAATEAIRFLATLRPPDDRIPLLNDSVFGEAIPLTACLEYARAVGVSIDSEPGKKGDELSVSLPESGFYWLSSRGTQMLIAAHEVAVPHLPAHAHVHPGQVCLWIDGKRVLTDTGVYEYEAGLRRQRARSIRSHNTVQVGESEPVRIGSSFWLWGTINPQVEYREDEHLRMTYSVTGIRNPKYEHERIVEAARDGWRITDHLAGQERPAFSRLHVHPRWMVDIDNEQGLVTIRGRDSAPIMEVEAFGHSGMAIETAPYYPEFGSEEDRSVIVICREIPGSFGVQLSLPVCYSNRQN